MSEKFRPTNESRENKPNAFVQIELKNLSEAKKESEDASFLDKQSKLIVAADGVTRGPFSNSSEYPYPSPAAKAAKVFAETFGTFLANRSAISKQDLLAAAYKANLEIQQLNKDLGLWNQVDYLENDFASTVFGAAIIRGNEMLYAYMGDSGVAKIDKDGLLQFITEDEVTPIRPSFPKVEDVGAEERFLRVRKDFRNNPDADFPTYGTITGEEQAMSYVRIGSVPVQKGDTILAYSDGVIDFIRNSSEFRKLLAQGSQQQISSWIEKNQDRKKHKDDKTLVLYRVE